MIDNHQPFYCCYTGHCHPDKLLCFLWEELMGGGGGRREEEGEEGGGRRGGRRGESVSTLGCSLVVIVVKEGLS